MSDDTEIITKEEKKALVPRFLKVFLSIPSVVIDGTIVFMVAVLTAQSLYLTNDDAYKYIPALPLYWLKFAVGSSTAGLVALQSFRNKVFAEHVAKKETDATK